MSTKQSEQNCASCTQQDTDNMVQCDLCDRWHHFECAGVSADVENQAWSCKDCQNTSVSSVVTLKYPEHCESQQQQDAATAKYKELAAAAAQSGDVSVINSTSIQRNLQIQRLEEERKLSQWRLQEQKRLDDEYLEKKYQLLNQVDQGNCDNAHQKERYVEFRTPTDIKYNSITPAQSLYPPSATSTGLPASSVGQGMVRNGIQKELPIFSGRPEDWPLFISSYETSNAVHGFSNIENLLRLQACLRGRALEAVRSLLLMPSTVPEAIETLRMLYGRPELIINTLIQQVRKELSLRIDKPDTVINYAVRVRNLCATIKASGLEEHINNPLLKQELVDKLPPQLKLNWAMYSVDTKNTNLIVFSNWLYNIARAMSTITTPYTSSMNETKERATFTKQNKPVYIHKEVQPDHKEEKICIICNGQHEVEECEIFLSSALAEKWSMVRKFKLCKYCLRVHNYFKCKKVKECNIDNCKAKHNRLLHNNSAKENRSTASTGFHNLQHHTNESVLLRIVPVTLHGNNISISTYALLDEGSSITLIERDMADKLKLTGNCERLCLKWTGDTIREESNSKRVTLRISAKNTGNICYSITNACTINSLNLPVQTISLPEMIKKYNYLKNIPIESYEKAVPTILIGIDNWKLGIPLRVVERKWSEPIATKTRLGWVIGGGNPDKIKYHTVLHQHRGCECDETTHQLVKDFLECNDIAPPKLPLLSKEEERSTEILTNSVKRIGERFESGLLWKYSNVQLPNSYDMALKRLNCLEKQSKRVPELLDNINSQIENLIKKGYARKLTEKELKRIPPRVWYLPIFVVRNPNKPNKIRLVWDAAATVEGISLNTMLFKGPDQLVPLIAVLQKFREKKIAVTGDLKEMFHQIRVKEEDQHVQRFLWRNAESDRSPDVYVMQALTFGASCSPSIAQYVKNTNAKEFSDLYPEAAQAIIDCHYVDDLLISVDSPMEAINLAKQIRYIHGKGGFEIHNWLSNSSEVLRALNVQRQESKDLLTSKPNQAEKILGLWWRAKDDKFTFVVKYAKVDPSILQGKTMPTKRQLLQILMSIFDPLGFLSHYLIGLKILLQEIWRFNIDWDEVIPERLKKEWLHWLHLLPQVEKVRIPRCYSTLTGQKGVCVQLHIFVDASQEAMAAVAYFRIAVGENIAVALVAAKTKVAPQQPTSIPRLELQAAVIGVRLANSILQSHKISIRQKHFWSDSRTVLSWVKSDAKRYKPYVMHRVGEILESTKMKEWKWVPSKLNTADIATKRQKTPMFDSNGPWFIGPEFLKNSEENWPETSEKIEDNVVEELRPKYLLAHFTVTVLKVVKFDRFSNWWRLLRTVAWVLRYIHNLKSKASGEELHNSPLSSSELQRARVKILQSVQAEAYSEEITLLKYEKAVPRSSPIFNCSPYVSDDGLLKMKGRIDKVPIENQNLKRPVLLPKSHHVTKLLVLYYHVKYHHCCHETVVNEIRQTYWIPGLRALAKSLRKQCSYCREQNAKPLYPEMSALPPERLAVFTRPFTNVGVDYFGPISVVSGRRSEKRWGVLFTCLTIRAIHIEIAHSLSTDSCIMAIRNFMARRGTPKTFCSDNGTNFKGAEKELREEFGKMNTSAVINQINTPETEWKFIPPSAPHMGGCWERLIGSVKKVLYHICQNKRLNDESLRCFLMEVENIINSRPLTYMSMESSCMEALTPNHFLIGSSSGSKSPGDFYEKDLYLRKNWRIAQLMANEFWKRWIREYLPTLTRRPKWVEKVENLKEGDLVLVVDENNPRNIWPKGIILRTVIAEDGQVRKATVRTSTGIYERPVVKLALVERHTKYDEGETSASSARPAGGEC